MAAIFYTSPINNQTIFKNGMSINNSLSLPFMNNILGAAGMLIITEVTMQHRETVQYFLTFDDFISYYYFGRGLGSLQISGMIFSDPTGYFGGLTQFTNMIGNIRGRSQNISFGNIVLTVVLNSFTLRASSDINMVNFIDFNLQMDIVGNSMTPPTFTSNC